MLNTNILPNSERKRAAFDGYRRLFLLWVGAVSSAFIVGIAILLPVYLQFFLEAREFERGRLIEEEAFQKLNISSTLETFREARNRIGELRAFLTDPPRASRLADFLMEARGITITSFTVEKGGTIAISGFAPTRSLLLAFEKALKDSERFEEISFPLSNLIRESDINFTIRGKLKKVYRL